MAISTSAITQKLHRQTFENFKPFAEQLIREGKTEREIVASFQTLMRRKVNDYYQKVRGPQLVMGFIPNTIKKIQESTADSKAEIIFCDLLRQHQIDYKFQYKIGKYRADFLIDKWLIVEIDGQQHGHQKEYDAIRDKYLNKKGYSVLRIPLWILLNVKDAAIEEIKQLLKEKNGKT